MSKFKIYLKAILIPVILGGLIGLFSSSSIDYDTLVKPALAPPSAIFPIVWTILYILMGISYGILKSNSLLDGNTKFLYYLQLVVNLLWPIFFFVFKWRFFSFIWIIILVLLVIAMISEFYAKNKTAGLLQTPYLLWLFFATYLNLSTYLLNRWNKEEPDLSSQSKITVGSPRTLLFTQWLLYSYNDTDWLHLIRQLRCHLLLNWKAWWERLIIWMEVHIWDLHINQQVLQLLII